MEYSIRAVLALLQYDLVPDILSAWLIQVYVHEYCRGSFNWSTREHLTFHIMLPTIQSYTLVSSTSTGWASCFLSSSSVINSK